MATKLENLNNPASCWNKAADDEPLFIIRGVDPLAPDTVRCWAAFSASEHYETHSIEKVSMALKLAHRMEEYARRPKMPKPDHINWNLERENFEKEMSRNGLFNMTRGQGGLYVQTVVEFMWKAWSSRAYLEKNPTSPDAG